MKTLTDRERAVVEAARRRVEEGHDAFCAVFVEHAGMPCNCGHDALAAALRDLDTPCETCGGRNMVEPKPGERRHECQDCRCWYDCPTCGGAR